MSVQVTVIFKNERASIDAIVLDASISETHTFEVEVTEHPVESGSNIIDHMRPKPASISIEGMITNTPLPLPADPLNRQTVDNFNYSTNAAFKPSRAGDALQQLLKLKDAGTLITVSTTIATYSNMLLKKVSVPRDASTGQTLHVALELIEVRTASAEVVQVEPKAKPTVKLGKKTAEPAPAKLNSTANAAFNFLSGNGNTTPNNGFVDAWFH